MEVYDLRSWYL